jgi:UDP-N-acetylmuramoylalanine--D-glutamate ligase
LLGDVEQMTLDDWVVLELSSFQLAHLSETAPRPPLAVVTNCTPNHLDWHCDFDHYARAKQRLIVGQTPGSVVILNPHDSVSSAWSALAPGRTQAAWPLERVGSLVVPGRHNRHNAACAAAAARAAGVSDAAIREALANFQGLDHRLQRVAEVAGRDFYNDSKSTSPEATLAALAALDQPVWLLAGGQSKGESFEALAGAIVARAKGAALFGAARDTLSSCISARRADFALQKCQRLSDALDWCWRRSQRGDAILLSPACASYDQFADFAARGAAFCHLVGQLATRLAH